MGLEAAATLLGCLVGGAVLLVVACCLGVLFDF